MLTKSDTKIIKDLLKPLEQDVTSLKVDVKVIKADVAKIRKDVDAVVDFFDKEYLDIRKRVERIEEHLGLTPLQ